MLNFSDDLLSGVVFNIVWVEILWYLLLMNFVEFNDKILLFGIFFLRQHLRLSIFALNLRFGEAIDDFIEPSKHIFNLVTRTL